MRGIWGWLEKVEKLTCRKKRTKGFSRLKKRIGNFVLR